MTQDDLLMFGIPLAAFLFVLFPSFWFAKWRNGMGLVCIGTLWAGFTGMMFFGMENATGLDGIGFAMALVGVSAPTGAAALIGSTIGWFKRGNAMHA